MKNTRAYSTSSRILSLSLLLALTAVCVSAQRARTVGNGTSDSAQTTNTTTSTTPAPQTVRAKYEGGLFGYNSKIEGTLSFDDANRRLLFRNKRGQETFSLPYDAVVAAFADTRSRRPTAASVIAGVGGIYGLPALLVRKKYRYLTLQYSDPDTNASGVTSFKLDNKDVLNSMVSTLAGKAGLVRRGEVFVRRRDNQNRDTMQTTVPTPPEN